MKKDHMMVLATRLYNDDVYDDYEIIYLCSATVHCFAFIDWNDPALSVSLHIQHGRQEASWVIGSLRSRAIYRRPC